MEPADPNPYKDVQSLVRGFQIIEALSALGWSKVGNLSKAAKVQRTSAYRVVNTLMQLGYVTRRHDDGAIALSPKFAALASSLKDEDIVTQFAWPPLFELSRDVLWPCDFASLQGGRVLIRLSTHKISPMSIHRGMVGKERYLVRSALGMAILSAMAEDERDAALAITEGIGGPNAADVRGRDAVHRLAEEVRQRGYAGSTGQTEAKISAIAVPVMSPQGMVAGAINIVFFRSAMTTEQAAARYLVKLLGCARQIEQTWRDYEERNATDA